jgi:hypothetical protein
MSRRQNRPTLSKSVKMVGMKQQDAQDGVGMITT